MNDEGPYTFQVHGDLGSMQCQVRGGGAGDILVAVFQTLIGPLFPALCWFVVLAFLWAEPTPQAVQGLLLVAGFATCVLGLVGLVWSMLVPHYIRWRVAFAAVLALAIGVAGYIGGLPGVEVWGPLVVLWGDAVVAALRLGVRWSKPTSLSLDAHGVTVDGVRTPLEGLELRVEGRDLCIADQRIPMGAHAPWEREWLADRIARARDAAAQGPQRVEDREELERLMGRRRQAQ